MTSNMITVLDELATVPENGKAEIINGEVTRMSPTGFFPGRAGGEIYASLRAYERRTKSGYALPDNVGFAVDLPHRNSFSPDAAFYIGPNTGMRFLDGAPAFAAEVRSEHDYGDTAERAMASKCADYFAAGTLVVWDINLLSEDVISVYRIDDPANPTLYRRGELAEAEPAVPGWRFTINDLFE